MAVHVTLTDGIGRVVLDHPPLNILTRAVLAEVREAFAELGAEPTLRVVILSAAGKHFSAGASVEEHLPPHVSSMIPEFMETIEALETFPLPVVSAVQGRCLGGAFELALTADLIVAADASLFAVPEIQLGVFPPAACLQLGRRCTGGLAAELIFTGNLVRASELEAAGLIRRVVPDSDLAGEAMAIASRIARNSGAALRVAKRALRLGLLGGDTAATDIRALYLGDLMSTRDALEGLMSFMEKRTPHWSHA